MSRAISILITIFIFYGCELIIIGSKKPPVIEINQKSPLGTVFLFKAELDSNNIPAAVDILAHPNGQFYLAYERYELYDEVARIGRTIRKKEITSIKTDSLAVTKYRINMEFDYLKSMTFTTAKINENWYIIGYTE